MLSMNTVNRIMIPRIDSDLVSNDDHSPAFREHVALSCSSSDTSDFSASSAFTSPKKSAGVAERDDYEYPLHLVVKIRPSPPSCNSKKSSQASDIPPSPYMSSFALPSPMRTLRRVRSNSLIHTEPIRRIVSNSCGTYDINDVKKNLAEVMGFYGDGTTRLRGLPIRSLGGSLVNQKQPAKLPQRKVNPLLISAENPYKILWDVLTLFLSLANAYATHTAVRDREFGGSFRLFCEIWFVVDILLNFVTEYKSGQGLILRDCRSVWARYLTSWFVVDVLSLFPVESLYIQPIIDKQNRRGIFKKSFFRTRAVVRVTRILRGRHFKLFGRVVGHTKYAGVGASRLLRLLIKYIPKYLLFFRNMKAILALRLLRQAHYVGKIWKYLIGTGCVAVESTRSSIANHVSKQKQELLTNDSEWEPF